jgi:hypothetical protein
VGDAEDKPAGHSVDFLDRWSRRKLADQRGESLDEPLPAAPVADSVLQQTTTDVDTVPAQQLTDADMPALDSLDADSDFSLFMSPGVSEQLRTQALRKLFHLPAFNVTDGLNDYDEDYTEFAGLGNVVTQEMKRMLKRELETGDVPDDEEQPAAHQAPVLPAEDVTENSGDMDDDSGETV